MATIVTRAKLRIIKLTMLFFVSWNNSNCIESFVKKTGGYHVYSYLSFFARS